MLADTGAPSREPGGFLSTPESWDAFGKGSPPQGHPSLGLPELALWLEELGWAPCPSRGELARRPAGRAGPGLAPVGTRIWISVSGWGHLISVNWMAAKASGDSGARKSRLISFFSQFEASTTSSDLGGHIFLVASATRLLLPPLRNPGVKLSSPSSSENVTFEVIHAECSGCRGDSERRVCTGATPASFKGQQPTPVSVPSAGGACPPPHGPGLCTAISPAFSASTLSAPKHRTRLQRSALQYRR